MEQHTDQITASYHRHLRLSKLSPYTIVEYKYAVSKVEAFIQAPAHTVTVFQLEEIFEAWTDHYAETTVRQMWINLSGYYKWCLRRGFIETNPLAEIPLPSAVDTPPRVLTLDQLRSLINACKGTTLIDRRDEAIVRCMSEPGGMRAAEVRLMRVEAIDWVNQLVEVTGKTGTRLISLSDRTMTAMERYVALGEIDDGRQRVRTRQGGTAGAGVLPWVRVG